jgi:RNA polymerase sigma-70 factor, ECF subfamily
MATGFDCEFDIGQLRARGSDAASDLFCLYRDKLLRMITFRLDSRLLSKVTSEDILQDVFVEAVRRMPRYLEQPGVHVFVWLRQLAQQVLIDTHRRYLGAQMRDVHQEVRLYCPGGEDTSSAYLVEQLADSLTTPSQCVLRSEAVAAVRASLEELEPIDREVLVLRHLEELSNNEVAEVLGIDRFAASKRYLRALARLKRVMPAEQDAP